MDGSADLGTDYVLSVNGEYIERYFTVPAGETHVDILITPVKSPTVEGQEWMRLTVLEAVDLTTGQDGGSG